LATGIVHEDRTIRTKGAPNGAPWRCNGCKSTTAYGSLDVGQEVDEFEASDDLLMPYCDTPECYTGMGPARRRRVRRAPAEGTKPAGSALTLPVDSSARKDVPMVRGLIDYFPAALAAVAALSLKASKQHGHGDDMHWQRGKSNDHADCIVRHIVDRGTVDPIDNERHSVKIAWRALALLQEELEEEGAPMSRASRPE
jgi:hypothetical protein